MCQKPVRVRDKWGLHLTTAQCRKCTECIKARKRSFTGKILAEMQTSAYTLFATFTYGGGYDNPAAYVMQYRHFQKYLKQLRKHGFKVRYLCVGEFGTERGRVHFHAMLFFDELPYPWKLNERIDCPFWPYGKAQYEKPRSAQASAAYIMDYLDKSNLSKAELKYSVRPMLGETYLIDWATEQARMGLPIFQNGNVYSVPGNTRADGRLFYYPIERDRAAYRKVIESWITEWIRVRPSEAMPLNEELQNWIDEEYLVIHRWPESWKEYFGRMYDLHEPSRILRMHIQLDAQHHVTVWPAVARLTKIDGGKIQWAKVLQLPPSADGKPVELLREVQGRHEPHEALLTLATAFVQDPQTSSVTSPGRGPDRNPAERWAKKRSMESGKREPPSGGSRGARPPFPMPCAALVRQNAPHSQPRSGKPNQSSKLSTGGD